MNKKVQRSDDTRDEHILITYEASNLVRIMRTRCETTSSFFAGEICVFRHSQRRAKNLILTTSLFR